MLHAKFHDHRTISYVRFLKAFTIYGRGHVAILVMLPGPFIYTFFPSFQGGST